MKKVYGVGYGTRGGKWKTYINLNGKGVRTKEYRIWKNMLTRCYSEKYHDKHPTYKGCFVIEEWLDFQVFAEWLTSQEFYLDGYELDKDILVRGNKIYSPETCALVPYEINKLLLDSGATRGEFPIGVSWHRKAGKFMAQLRAGGEHVYLGLHTCEESASSAYTLAKEEYVKKVANRWRGFMQEEVYLTLMSWTVLGASND